MALPLTITFLGTGTSQGVPVIGCDCPVCTSPDPRDRRTRSSIYVETPEACWVVDTGPEFRVQCLRENVRRVDAVVYTHAHTDHIMGFDDLRPFGVDRELPIYASPSTMASLEQVFEFAFSGQNLFPGYLRPERHYIEGPFSLGETMVTPLPLKHGRAEVNGFLLEAGGRKLAAYLSDCKEVPASVIAAIHGVEALVIDALRHRDHPTHLSVAEATAVAGQVAPGRTWFTHLCHELEHAATEAMLPPDIRIAYDGLKLEFS